jgi:hypothetical protein
VIFFELIAGVPPFRGTVLEVINAQLEGRAPPAPSSLIADPIEERTDQVILHALATDPAARPRDVDEFLFELRTLMSMMGMHKRRHVPPRAAMAVIPTRQHKRYRAVVPVTMRSGDRPLVGVTENLGTGGLFVALAGAPRLGTEVEVELPSLPAEAAPQRLRAVVRWLRPGDGQVPAGCGLEWVQPTAALRARLRATIGR